jgi:hypothetical protein
LRAAHPAHHGNVVTRVLAAGGIPLQLGGQLGAAQPRRTFERLGELTFVEDPLGCASIREAIGVEDQGIAGGQGDLSRAVLGLR